MYICREFQSTHLQEVRLDIVSETLPHLKFQSTHLQEVRHGPSHARGGIPIVSIHAPTRGATQTKQTSRRTILFQSTHLQEVRLKRAASILQYMYVSIHAPTRGATEVLRCLFSIVTVSIHAPTRGATDVGKFRCDFTVLFQSTHLQEVRLAILSASVTHAFVSIHAPTRGATALWQTGDRRTLVSIHAPTRGATVYM